MRRFRKSFSVIHIGLVVSSHYFHPQGGPPGLEDKEFDGTETDIAAISGD